MEITAILKLACTSMGCRTRIDKCQPRDHDIVVSAQSHFAGVEAPAIGHDAMHGQWPVMCDSGVANEITVDITHAVMHRYSCSTRPVRSGGNP
jgi:hypothetical protein